jgi:hypothetical protein
MTPSLRIRHPIPKLQIKPAALSRKSRIVSSKSAALLLIRQPLRRLARRTARHCHFQGNNLIPPRWTVPYPPDMRDAVQAKLKRHAAIIVAVNMSQRSKEHAAATRPGGGPPLSIQRRDGCPCGRRHNCRFSRRTHAYTARQRPLDRFSPTRQAGRHLPTRISRVAWPLAGHAY